MNKLSATLLLFGLVASACGDAGSFAIEITFPDQPAREATTRVRVVAVTDTGAGTCAALVAGDAAPGDADYPVEDQTTIPLDDGAGPGLDLADQGAKLFFAEGLDATSQVILRGCTPVTADGSTQRVITIALQWLEAECQADADCEDDDDAWCTGYPRCVGGECTIEVPDCDDQIDCTLDACDEDLDACSHTPDATVCDDQDVCTGTETCDPIAGCQAGQALVCDDGVFCNGAETCDPDSGCQAGVAPNCDDGIPCTIDACNPVDDACESVPNAGGCPEIHIGPAADTCPHDLPDGTPVTACDYTGQTGVIDATAAASVDGAVFLIHDDLGQPAWYDGPVDVPGGSWIGAAPGVDLNQVTIGVPYDTQLDNGALRLTGDDIHVDGLSLVITEDNEFFISARPSENDHANATDGHLIERVAGFAISQEVIGANSIGPPVAVGNATTVRNCHFYGYFELRVDATGKDHVRFVHNTFVSYQALDNAIDATGTSGFVFANNVLLSLAQPIDYAVVADLATTDMHITGNLLEGVNAPAAGYNPGDPSVVIQDNLLGAAEMEAPSQPVFLADSLQTVPAPSVGEGVSLDGVDIDGQAGVLPGAYQLRSDQGLPRSALITVGRGDCGGGPCDVDADEVAQEIQKAAWRAWPYSDIQIYPSDEAYAGMVVIGWPVRISGVGDAEDDVRLLNVWEDPLLEAYNIYDRHDASVIVLQHIAGPVVLRDLTLQVDSTTAGDNYAIYTEDRIDPDEADWPPHRFTRLKVTSLGTEPGLFSALYLGARAMVTDSLILGGFQSCATWGPRRAESQATQPSDANLINLTCRMIGTGSQSPSEFFNVASADGAVILNFVGEAEAGAVPLFRAQRRSSGDTGTTALDPPIQFNAQALTVRGMSAPYDGFTDAEGDYTVADLDELGAADALFVGVGDSMLDAACTAIDSGVQPGDVDPDLPPGTSLDGVDRSGRDIDRGCYEQGQ